MKSSSRSTQQMDDFYAALSIGAVKTSGIMNYIQHLYIAQKYPMNGRILDMCCGRSLLLPLLNQCATTPIEYVGIDISEENLRSARSTLSKLQPFNPLLKTSFVCGDVAKMQEFAIGSFDAIAYTSSIEHMPKEAGIDSLRQAHHILANNGTLFLSTPNTPTSKLQYKVHIYEWSDSDLVEALNETGFNIEKKFGLLPGNRDHALVEVAEAFGSQARVLMVRLAQTMPQQFFDPILAMVTPRTAKELFYVCQKARK